MSTRQKRLAFHMYDVFKPNQIRGLGVGITTGDIQEVDDVKLLGENINDLDIPSTQYLVYYTSGFEATRDIKHRFLDSEEEAILEKGTPGTLHLTSEGTVLFTDRTGATVSQLVSATDITGFKGLINEHFSYTAAVTFGVAALAIARGSSQIQFDLNTDRLFATAGGGTAAFKESHLVSTLIKGNINKKVEKLAITILGLAHAFKESAYVEDSIQFKILKGGTLIQVTSVEENTVLMFIHLGFKEGQVRTRFEAIGVSGLTGVKSSGVFSGTKVEEAIKTVYSKSLNEAARAQFNVLSYMTSRKPMPEDKSMYDYENRNPRLLTPQTAKALDLFNQVAGKAWETSTAIIDGRGLTIYHDRDGEPIYEANIARDGLISKVSHVDYSGMNLTSLARLVGNKHIEATFLEYAPTYLLPNYKVFEIGHPLTDE